jgi:hypothetical protein
MYSSSGKTAEVKMRLEHQTGKVSDVHQTEDVIVRKKCQMT